MRKHCYHSNTQLLHAACYQQGRHTEFNLSTRGNSEIHCRFFPTHVFASILRMPCSFADAKQSKRAGSRHCNGFV